MKRIRVRAVHVPRAGNANKPDMPTIEIDDEESVVSVYLDNSRWVIFVAGPDPRKTL